MAELVYVHTKELPPLIVTGRKLEVDRTEGDNPIPAFWEQCTSDGTLDRISELEDFIYDPDYVGFITNFRGDQGMIFDYYCGILLHPHAPVPDGFDSHEVPEGTVGIGWIRGQSVDEIAPASHQLTQEALEKRGFTCGEPAWVMELYNEKRFVQPDAQGRLIMDYYIPCLPRDL